MAKRVPLPVLKELMGHARIETTSPSCPDIRSHKDTAKIGAWSVMQISALSDLSV